MKFDDNHSLYQEVDLILKERISKLDEQTPDQAMDSKSVETDMKSVNQPSPCQLSDLISEKNDMKFDDSSSCKAVNLISGEESMKLKEPPSPCQVIDLISEKTGMKSEDELSPYQAMDLTSEDSDMKFEDEPFSRAMGLSLIDTGVKLEDKPSLYQEIDLVSKEIEMKLADELSSYETMVDLSSEETDMVVENGSYSRQLVSEKSDRIVEKEPMPSISTHDSRPVQQIRKRNQRREVLSFKPYIRRVKKKAMPEMQLSSDTLVAIDNLISNVYKMYCSEMRQLLKQTGKKTLTDKDVECVTNLRLSGNLKDHAIICARNFLDFQKKLKKNPGGIQEI